MSSDDFLSEETEEEQEEEFIESTRADSSSAEPNTLVRPADNISEIADMYDQFDEVKKQLLRPEDVTQISGNIHVNKSGWRKIATAFNLSVEAVGDPHIQTQDGVVHVTVKAKAEAENGKSATSTGTCSSNESNFMDALKETDEWDEDDDDVMEIDGRWRRLKAPNEVNRHNLIATAETRAKNRAISDLVGGGEVSAEELDFDLAEEAKNDVFG